MPAAPRTPCAICHRLKPCGQHDTIRQDRNRLYDARWRKYRSAFLRTHPLCLDHLHLGESVEATVVDHIKPHRGNVDAFWDSRNHQPLCKRCHDRKTVRDGNSFSRGGGG